MKPFLTFLATCLIMVSCHNEVNEKLNYIESIVFEHPDIALTEIYALDKEDLCTRRQKAKYSLLSSIAYDKNAIDIANDSLIRVAVDYYNEKGTDREIMLSLYYQGIVLSNANNYSSALISFEKSLSLALSEKDYLYQGLIYRNLSRIYSVTNNNPQSIEYDSLSVESFRLSGKQNYRDYAVMSLAIDYINNNEFSKARKTLDDLRSITDDRVLLINCDRFYARILANEGKLEESVQLFEKADTTYLDFMDYATSANILQSLGRDHDAAVSLSRAYSHCHSKEDSATVAYFQSDMERMKGNYKEALLLNRHALLVQDSLTRDILRQSVSVSLKEHYSEQARQFEIEMKRKELSYYRRLFFIICALAIIVFLAKRRQYLRRKETADQMARLSDSLIAFQDANISLIGSQFETNLMTLQELSNIYFETDEREKKAKIEDRFRREVNKLGKSEALFRSLEESLNCYCNDVMKKIDKEVPSIKGENRSILMMFFTGIPYDTIKMVTKRPSVTSLRTLKGRLKKEILSSNAEDKELFLSLLLKKATANSNKS